MEKPTYAYRLTNGKIVHPDCREAYQKKTARSGIYHAIAAGLFPGFAMPAGRFQLCDHCEAPIWEAPKTTNANS